MKPHYLLTIAMLVAGSAVYSQIKNISSLGRELPTATAKQWIKNNSLDCHEPTIFCMSKEVVSSMFSAEVSSGVYIFNALDESGRDQLIFKVADESGNTADQGIVYLAQPFAGRPASACGKTMQTWDAFPMVEKFQSVCKNRFSAHAYGRKIFDQILAQKGAEGVFITTGIDGNNEEHLILGAIDKDGMPMWQSSLFNHGSGIFFLLFIKDSLSIAKK
jgi:hypothetical protein